MPLSRRIFSVTGTGPVSMIVGSVPILAVARIRARGLRPWRTPKSRLPISTAAAPSTMPEELPAWWTWLIRSRCGYFRIATASKPGMVSPMSLNEGLSAPSDCMSVPGRMCSSRSRIGRPLTSRHRHDGLREAVVVPGGGGALLALDGEEVAVVAGEAEFGGDDVGADALRHEVGLERDRGVDGDGGAVGAHRRRGSSSRRRRRCSRRPRRRAPGWRRGSPPRARRRRSG